MADSEKRLGVLVPEALDFLNIIYQTDHFGAIADYKVLNSNVCLLLTKEVVNEPSCDPTVISRVYAFHHGRISRKQFSFLLRERQHSGKSGHDIQRIKWASLKERASGISLKTSLETAEDSHNYVTTFRFDMPESRPTFGTADKNDFDLLARYCHDLRQEIRSDLIQEWVRQPDMKVRDVDTLVPDEDGGLIEKRTHQPYRRPNISKVFMFRTGVASFWSTHQCGVREGKPLMCHQLWLMTKEYLLQDKEPAYQKVTASIGKSYLHLLTANPNRAIVEVGRSKSVLPL